MSWRTQVNEWSSADSFSGKGVHKINSSFARQLLILTQACMMTASIEMKSPESEAPLRGIMVKVTPCDTPECMCSFYSMFCAAERHLRIT